MAMLIQNGRVVTADRDEIADVLVEDGKVTKVESGIAPASETDVIDATGKLVFPGFVDPHVHIHLPFMRTTAKDTYETASRTALVCVNKALYVALLKHMNIARYRHSSSIYKLHLHRALRRVGISYLGVRPVQQVAAMAGPMFEVAEAIRAGKLDELLPKRPDVEAWRNLYRDHHGLTRAMGNAMPDLWGMTGDQTLEMLQCAREISRLERRHPGSTAEGLRAEYGPAGLRRMVLVGLRQVERGYKNHLRQLRRDLRKDFADDTADFEAALHKGPETYFYLRLVIPALLLWRTTPQRMYRRLRSPASAGQQAEVVERMVRLDPWAMTYPEVTGWINCDDGPSRRQREQSALKWRGQGLKHGRLDAVGFKAVMGALIQSIASRMGRYLDLQGGWHDSGLTATQVRDLFHAKEKDRTGQSLGVFDTDLADIELESWSRQLRRYRPMWDQVVPYIGGPKSDGVVSGAKAD